MRYSDIKRLTDELFRQFLRKVDARLRKAEKREVPIRMGLYEGDMPEQFGPATIYDRSLQIYKVNVQFSGDGAAFDFTVDGSLASESITEATTFPYFLETPIKWTKGEKLVVTVNSSSSLDEFEIVLTAREV